MSKIAEDYYMVHVADVIEMASSRDRITKAYDDGLEKGITVGMEIALKYFKLVSENGENKVILNVPKKLIKEYINNLEL